MRLELYYEPDNVLDCPENEGLYGADIRGIVKDIQETGAEYKVIDVAGLPRQEIEDLYTQLAVPPSVRERYSIRRIFGTNKYPGCFFGRGVPALVVLEDGRPRDVYPHEEAGKIVTIMDYFQLTDDDGSAWKELERTFVLEDYLNDRHFTDEAVDELLKHDVLILPGLPGEEHPPPADDAETFVTWAPDLRKIFQRDGVSAALVADPNLPKRQMVRKEADVWLPPLVLLGGAAFSLALNVLGNWIYDRFGRPSPSDEDGDRVDIEILEVTSKDETLTRICYRGPANRLVKLLRTLADKERKEG